MAGLRREEVALLAGISVDYYTRIEQGRETSPSDRVLDAIARALHLDEEGAAYMSGLIRQPRHAPPQTPAQLDPALDCLIAGWSLSPTRIHDGALNILSANPVAIALCPSLSPGSNTLRALFLDPAMKSFHRDWERRAACAVSWVRSRAGRHPDPALTCVVDELTEKSQAFRELWSRHDIRPEIGGTTRITHPRMGSLTLNFQHMLLPRTDHVLITSWATPGSDSERALRRLGAPHRG